MTNLIATITCPICKHAARCAMPTDRYVIVYECARCHATLKPKQGDCCVFCSHADLPCPQKQDQAYGL
jgi:Zn ribbon nucleic-acid-binding protein